MDFILLVLVHLSGPLDLPGPRIQLISNAFQLYVTCQFNEPSVTSADEKVDCGTLPDTSFELCRRPFTSRIGVFRINVLSWVWFAHFLLTSKDIMTTG